MKTFKSEHRELLDWYMKESDRLDNIPYKGLDGPGEAERRQIKSEYHKRFKELKDNYCLE